MEQDKGASAKADRAIVNGAASVSAVPASVPSASNITNRYVTESAERPMGQKGECFYCRQPIGSLHGVNCVIPQRRVRIRVEIEYESDFPACFDDDMIEFSLNESSSCADNELERIESFSKEQGCLCAWAEFTVLGPANPASIAIAGE